MELGLTQVAAARSAGVSVATWRSIETGEQRERRATTWHQIERVLGLSNDTPVLRAERAIEHVIAAYASADADPFFDIVRPHLNEDIR